MLASNVREKLDFHPCHLPQLNPAEKIWLHTKAAVTASGLHGSMAALAAVIRLFG